MQEKNIRSIDKDTEEMVGFQYLSYKYLTSPGCRLFLQKLDLKWRRAELNLTSKNFNNKTVSKSFNVLVQLSRGAV